jgi:outer membrane protein TolC
MLAVWSVWARAADNVPLDATPRTIDLDAACRLALAANPSPAAAAARVEAAIQRVRQARSRYFPRLDAGAGVSRVDMAENDYRASLAQARFLNPTAGVADPQDYYRAELTASWTAFDGFERRFSLLAARYGALAAAEARDEACRILLAAVAEAFHGAQLSREAVAIAEADAEYNQRLMHEARIRHQVGTGALSEVLNFEVAANAARSEVIGARQQLAVTRSALAALLGFETAFLPDDWVLAELKSESEADRNVPEAADQLAYALAHRPDLRQSDQALKSAEAEIGVARSGFWPDVSLAATLSGDRANDARLSGDDLGDTLGISMSYNLFAGGYTRAKVAEARMNRTAIEKTLENDRLNVSAQVVRSLTDLAATVEQLDLQRRNAALVQRNRDLVEKEYAVGQASLVRLNEAQRNLVSARGRLARARVALDQARFSLDTATGRSLTRLAADRRPVP